MQQSKPVPLPPLVIDLDGTLTPSDTLIESLVALLRRKPVAVLLLAPSLLQGRAEFKGRVADEVRPGLQTLPWRSDFLAWLHEQRASGRRLILATAADERIAQAVASELGLFDLVLATNRERGNLKGPAKLAAIRAAIGDRFTYAGDSRADLCIWHAATSAVMVGALPGLVKEVRGKVPVEREFSPEGSTWQTWMKSLRLHQWIKNLLVFVPLLTSFTFLQPAKVGASIAAFVAFSLAASGTYLLNDLWDLENDRQHSRKRYRPLASGRMKIKDAIICSSLLLLSAVAAAAAVSLPFAITLIGYVALTSAYSWFLKAYVLLDVLALALLYTYRVLAGAVVIQVGVTPWLLAFSVFTFLGLALVKRAAELVDLQRQGKREATGRNYTVSDLAVIWPLGVGSGLCSVVVFGLYVNSAEARSLYGDTTLLWLVGVGLIYWVARMWIKTSRGEMHDDPIVFAIHDRGSRIAILVMIVLPVIMHILFRSQP